MNKPNLEFCFKGDRKYVHGTDIYNKTIASLNADINKNFDLAIHNQTVTNIALINKKPTDDEQICFSCKYLDKNSNRVVFYGITDGVAIKCSYPYDEEKIISRTLVNIDNQSIILKLDTSYTLMENIVALNKHLLQSIFKDKQGKWYFTRLQLSKIPKEKKYPIEIVLQHNFNFKLTKSQIIIQNELCGYIYFSLVKS